MADNEQREARWMQMLASPSLRVLALLGSLGALVLLIQNGHAPLLAWTKPILRPTTLPWLLVLFLCTYLVLQLRPEARKLALLAASIVAMAIFSLSFSLAVLAYLLLLRWVLASRVSHALKLGFVLLTYLALGISISMPLFPRFLASHQWLLLYVYMFATNFTFRLFYALHDAKQRPAARRGLVEFLLYFIFLPYFIVVPYMLAIPRYDRFARSLETPRWQTEARGIGMLLVGVVSIAALALCKTWVDADLLLATAAREGQWLRCLLLAPLTYPVWAVFKIIGTAYVLVALVNILGIELKPAFDAPLRSLSVVEWWRRWNLHFRDFLVDLFFMPLMLRFRRRNPYLTICLGCASVFLVGSTLFHYLAKHYVARASHAEVYWSIFAENLFFFLFVALALCLERRARETQRERPSQGHGGRTGYLLRLLATYYLVFAGVVLIGYSVHYLQVIRPLEDTREAIRASQRFIIEDDLQAACALASAQLPTAERLVRERPTDGERRVLLWRLLSITGANRERIDAGLSMAIAFSPPHSLATKPLLDTRFAEAACASDSQD